jgi:hypothetical protein
VSLLVGACGYLMLEPWHGPIVLALSEQHGVDTWDLPAVALIALAISMLASARRTRGRRTWRAGRRVAAVAVIALGVVLVAGILNPRIGSPLVAAAGGTFGRVTQHVDGVRAEPVGRWTHLAVTYDGSTYRLYVNGVETSSQTASGRIRRTGDPLWIGGNHPYGEFFRGVIDEVRVYSRALGPVEVRAAMAAPVASDPRQPGLVAAYGFEASAGGSVPDVSRNGNVAAIDGPSGTVAGRFGRGMRFDGDGQLLRVPASASLDLTRAMTVMAWIKPTASQSGWRTIVARQTDAYFLMAGGGRSDAVSLGALDRMRFVVAILLVVWIGVALVRGDAPWASGRGAWYWPVALFVAGSLLDALLAPADTVVGPALVAAWFGATSSQRDEKRAMFLLAAALAAVTAVSTADPGALPVPHADGGVVRAAALGLVLVLAGVFSLVRGAAQTRAVGP